MKLKDKVAIITGGGQGIGKEYALGFAREGAKVVIAEIKLENAQQVVKEIESQGGKAIAVRTDVTSEADASEVTEKTIATFGRIDALVNNAAIYYGIEMKPFEFISEKEWDAMMAVNVKGLFIMSKAVMPQMKKQKSGSIINISSGTWLFGIPYLLHYVTSKAAVVGFSRAM
ncbi:MAG TPA: SDR family NAD(P)-dependent oxidoreductase, partial [Nitrospiria bacterium]|nr:SDR family NAD(P)-dependent oxidoreductase [Nitrospiria bacterium]